MIKKLILSALLSGALSLALSFTANAHDVTVYSDSVTGPIKQMNCANNPPTKGNFAAYKALKIPYMRTHDTALYRGYGGQFAVDISGMFPDFSKNVNDPASYQFAETDIILKRTLDAGSKIFFRLGQSIENNCPIKHFVYPPKDFKKWAQICEHIIRHYNEGWADGFQWNIEYWEIWNEPDLDQENDGWKTSPRTWGGTPEQFNEFYGIAAKHLKKCFPALKIGGPAFASVTSKRSKPVVESFLKYVSENNIPLDFFSYHRYATGTEKFDRTIDSANELLERYGLGNVETWLNEWNYVRSFSENSGYSSVQRSEIKGAAFAAMVMSYCQNKKVDKLMYYDLRPMTSYNGVFPDYSKKLYPAYFALYSWRKLADLGTAVKAVSTRQDVTAVAAVGSDGKKAVFVTRYNDDDNENGIQAVSVKLTGLDAAVTEVFGYLTDDCHSFTEVPLDVKDGELIVRMKPNSFVYIVY